MNADGVWRSIGVGQSVSLVCKALKTADGRILRAAEALGVPRMVLSDFVAAHRLCRVARDEGRALGSERVRQNIDVLAEKGEPWAAKLILDESDRAEDRLLVTQEADEMAEAMAAPVIIYAVPTAYFIDQRTAQTDWELATRNVTPLVLQPGEVQQLQSEPPIDADPEAVVEATIIPVEEAS